MKRLLIAITVAMMFIANSSADDQAVWSTAVATRPSDGHRLIYRYRSEFGRSFKRSSYPDRVSIAWTYKSADGMPSKAERESMDRLENLLAPYVEQTSLSMLVLVSTGEGLREWVYYSKSQNDFMARVNEALRGLPRFPVEIDLWKDPEWKRYEAFKSTVHKKDAQPIIPPDLSRQAAPVR
jgi:hypothetical protein